jgi:hypothetical protein
MPGRTRQKVNSAGEPRGTPDPKAVPDRSRQVLMDRPESNEMMTDDNLKRRRKRKTGRKKLEINLDDFKKLASIQCTLVEIADWYGCSVETIKKRIREEPEYEEAWKHGMAKGRISIRRAQMRAIQDPNCKGHATMLVWLGKIFLAQQEVQKVDLNTDQAKQGPYQHPFVTEEEAESAEVPDGESLH